MVIVGCVQLHSVSVSVSQSQGYSGSVHHPCYPEGHSRILKFSSIFNSPCTESFKPSSYDPQASLTALGGGHYEDCLGNVSQIFSFGSCPFSQCSFDKVFQPNVSGSYMVRKPGGNMTQPASQMSVCTQRSTHCVSDAH